MVLQFILFATGLVILYYGAKWLVKAASSIAFQLGIRPMVIGLTVVAMGTSMPEFVLNFSAVLVGEDALAIGNIIGSNIANIALILGVSAVLLPFVLSAETLRKEYPLMLATSLLFYGLAADGMISRVDGGILVLGLMALMIFLVIDSRNHIRQGANGSGQLVPGQSADALQDSQLGNGGLSTRKNFLYLAGGMIGLTLGARLMVGSAVEIATILSIHPVVVGLTIVAIGTSLPELAASVVCAMKGETDMSVGNVLGSNMLNILFVVGLIAIIRPIAVEPVSIAQHFPVMIAFALVLYPIARFRKSISKMEGVFLLLTFAAYLGWLIYPYV